MLKEIVQNLNVRFLTVDSYLGGTFILGIPKKAKFDTFVGSIPPILNFIPLPSHQEVYCKTAHAQSCREKVGTRTSIFKTGVLLTELDGRDVYIKTTLRCCHEKHHFL